jgi:hypothetical protein
MNKHNELLITAAQTNATQNELGDFVPDSMVGEELHVTKMSIWRWDNDPKLAPKMAELGWPPRVKRGSRNGRFLGPLDQFKRNLMLRAIAERGQVLSAAVR